MTTAPASSRNLRSKCWQSLSVQHATGSRAEGGQGREGLVGSSGCAESGAFGLPGQKLTQSEILAAMKEMDEDGDTQFILPLLALSGKKRVK